VGAVVIPPVLNVLYQAYGFVGAMPHPGMDPARALAAPQPALMAALAQGILLHRLDWEMILIGAGLGVALILLDQLLRLRRLALPPLAVGMGIYLPSDVSVTIGIGAVLSYLVLRTVRNPKGENSTGTMIASGFIVGESLMGVVLAAVSGATGGSDALALPVPESWATAIGGACFVAVAAWFAYRIRAAEN